MSRIGPPPPPVLPKAEARTETRGPPPPPTPPRVQDVFERAVNNPAARLLGQVAQVALPGVAQTLQALQAQLARGGNPLSEVRGGPPPLTDTTGVDSIAPGQTDPVQDGSGPIGRTQRFLEEAGYLQMPQGASYGHFGQMTQDALIAFQQAEGITPADGLMSPATLEAMQHPHPRPDASLSHLAGAYSRQLGRPTSPLQPGENGSQVQHFENGSITLMPGGETFVRDTRGNDIVPPIQPSTVSSLEEASAFHVSQWGENGYNDGSEYYGGNDCGPTSVVIAASMVGVMAHPDAANAGEAIDGVRDNILDFDSTESTTMDVTQVTEGVEEAGAVATQLPQSVQSVDEALSRGHPVIIGGNPFGGDPAHQAWGPTASANGNYLMDHDFGGHWATVVGRTPEGNYIVNDPLCPNGPIEVTPEQMAEYIDGGFGVVEVAPPPPQAG